MEYITEAEEKKLGYYFGRYSHSLQKVVFARTGNYFHTNDKTPVEFVYLCLLCLKGSVVLDKGIYKFFEEFTDDHFPPKSVGGTNTILVCKPCNDKAGYEYDHALQLWLQFQSFGHGKENASIPVSLELENTKGRYKGSIGMGKDQDWVFDGFEQYPFAKDWFEKVIDGENLHQNVTFHQPKVVDIHRALLKAAYLYCFSIWGYDFIYTATGAGLRKILTENAVHPLSNYGTLFHKKDSFLPEGLSLIVKPIEIQSFVISFKLKDRKSGYEYGASVMIPGSEKEDWENFGKMQSMIDKDETISPMMIRLPEDALAPGSFYPYSTTWNNREVLPVYEKNNTENAGF